MICRIAFPLLLLAGCSDIPRDPDGTSDRIRAEGRFRIGLIEGSAASASQQRSFLARVQQRAGASAEIERGAAEPLLQKLEAGDFDLVLGAMSAKSPWEKQVHFLPALSEIVAPKSYVRVVPMARNGENEWIALLDREARAVASGG